MDPGDGAHRGGHYAMPTDPPPTEAVKRKGMDPTYVDGRLVISEDTNA